MPEPKGYTETPNKCVITERLGVVGLGKLITASHLIAKRLGMESVKSSSAGLFIWRRYATTVNLVDNRQQNSHRQED